MTAIETPPSATHRITFGQHGSHALLPVICEVYTDGLPQLSHVLPLALLTCPTSAAWRGVRVCRPGVPALGPTLLAYVRSNGFVADR